MESMRAARALKMGVAEGGGVGGRVVFVGPRRAPIAFAPVHKLRANLGLSILYLLKVCGHFQTHEGH